VKILIVKLSAFGDIVHALPALHDLLERPGVDEVHWLVDARYAFVTRLFPQLVRVHQVDLRGARPLQSAWQAVRGLRDAHFDAVLDLQGLIKSAVLASLSGSRVYGMDARHLREGLARFLLSTVPFQESERHVVQQYRRVAAAPFADKPEAMAYTPPRTEPDEAMLQTGDALLEHWKIGARRHVWLHLGGGWATKQLPLPTWQNIADTLLAEGMVPILGWGSQAEKVLAGRLAALVPEALLPEYRLSMDALCGVLARAAAVVGPDTGVLHLAAALDTPTVSFWGPSASWRSAPMGERHRQVESSPACGPCFKRECSQFVCMDMIRADAIISAIHEIASFS